MEIIRGVRHDYMLKRCGNVVARSMARARRHGMLRRPIDAAIDMHDIPLYAKGLMKYAVYSKYERGTKKFVRLATIHCVVAGQRLTLGVAVVRRGDETADVVERLLRGCRRRGIRVRSLAVDRGFHSVAVMRRAKKMGIPIVMPAVKLPRIKECIREYDAGERGAISEHTMTSASGRTASYKLVIVRRQNRTKGATKEAKKLAKLHEKEVRVTDKYHVFATTMPDSWIDDDPDKVAEFYRVRWGIENSYKSYEQMRPQNDQPQLLRPAPADHNAVRILQYMDAGPLHGGPPRRRPQRGDGPPPAVHAGPLHDDDGARGGRAVGRTWRASAGLGAPRYVKPIRATFATRRSMIRLPRAHAIAAPRGARRPSRRGASPYKPRAGSGCQVVSEQICPSWRSRVDVYSVTFCSGRNLYI